jgi:hypothetical protein
MRRLLMLLMLAVPVLGGHAAPASAIDFHSEISSTTLTGTQIGDDQFGFNHDLVECEEANYFGAQAGTTATTVSVRPVWELCSGFFQVTVDVKNCEYKLHLKSQLSSTTYLGDIQIVCPAGKEITFTLSLFGTSKCTIHVPPQTHGSTIATHNEGTGSGRDVKVLIDVENLVYHETAGTGFAACPTSSPVNGAIFAQMTLKGEEGTTQKGFWVA